MTRTLKNAQVESKGSDEDIIRQLVCFTLGPENYGVDICKVHEINRMVDITRIPESPSYVEGVINLRGELIPIIDLRKRFHIKTGYELKKENRIVVIETTGAPIGLIVDSVTEVLRIAASAIEPTPRIITTGVDIRYIEGVAKVEEDLLIILNTDLIFSEEEFESISALS